MRLIPLILCLFMAIPVATAQGERFEDVLARTNSLDNETQVDQLNEEFKKRACTDTQLAVSLYEKIQRLLLDVSYPEGEVTAIGYFAYYQYCQSNLDSALFYFKQAAARAKFYQLYSEQSGMVKNVGNVYLTKGVYDSSLSYFEIATTICKDQQDSTHLAGILMGKGIAYQNSGDLEKAMLSYLQAEKVAEKQKNINASITARLNRYTILSEHFPEQLDEEEFLITLNTCQDNNLQHAEATVLQFLGEAALDSGQFDKAVQYYQEGIVISTEIGRVDLRIYHIEGAANAHLQMKDYPTVIRLAQEGILLAQNADMTPNLVRLYITLAYANLGAKDYDASVAAALSSIRFATEHSELKEDLYKANKVLAEAYAKTGAFELAYEAQKTHTDITNEVLNTQKIDQLSELQIKYETEKVAAERELALERAKFAEKESEKNEQLFIGTLAIVFLIVLAAIFYFAKMKQAKKVELALLELKSSQRQLALQKQYRDSELKALKAQMNPHFIFNVLNSIQEFIVLNQKDLASEYLATFAELIRSYLHFSNQGYITMPEEIDNLKKYLELEALRFGEQFHYHVAVSEEVGNEANRIPTMIVQPYVENAIKHGLFNKKGDKNITLSFSLDLPGIVKCVIEDDGVGRHHARQHAERKSHTYKSFATEATASRLELLNQMSQSQIGVETIDLYQDDQPLGTKVILTIPLIKEN